MWESIGYITTPLSLIAFIAALATISYKRRLQSNKELINSAEALNRANLIEASLQTYHLKNDNLTKEQKFQLVQKVLDQKIQRLKINSYTLIILTAIFAVVALIGFEMMNKNSVSEPKIKSSEASINDLNKFIKISNQIIKQKITSPNMSTPFLLSEARSRFETFWYRSNLADKHFIPDSILYQAIYNNIEIYRVQESYDPTKPKTNEWASLGISYFENSNTIKYLSQLLLEKASVILDMTEQNRSDRSVFRNLVSEGDKLMMRAYSIQDQNSKGKVLRIWSRFYYDLSKPELNIYSDIWDNTYLKQAYQKALQAFLIDTTLLKNSTQLCRCIQKLSNNPPQDNDEKWITVMRSAFNKHVYLWNNSDSKLTDYADRIPPLNILAVLGYETILKEWEISVSNFALTKFFLTELDSLILPAQEEVAVLVESSEYKKEYAADVYIDLSKIHTLKFLILSNMNSKKDLQEFDQIIINLQKAKSAIRSTDQLDALKKSFDKEKVYAKLQISQRKKLKKIFN